MPEPESTPTLLHHSFVNLGPDQYALRSAPVMAPGGTPLPVEPLPLRISSVTDSRAVFEPAAGALLAFLPNSELPDGYYHLNGTWGNLKIAGGGEPTFADINNFAFYVNNTLVDELVALNGVSSTLNAYLNVGGYNLSIRTKVAGSPNVAYMGLLIATKISEPGFIVPVPP